MKKKGLGLSSFTQKVTPQYRVDSALLSMENQSLEQKEDSMIGKMHYNEPRNTDMPL
jgi:hypothetical protein